MNLEGLVTVIQGIVLGASICCSLGPQSVFVLRQGIHGKSAIAVAAICTVADLLLITAALLGAQAIILHLPEMAMIGVWGSAAFVAAYGLFALTAPLRRQPASAPDAAASRVRRPIFTVALALSLLNPQVYLEMIVLVGGIGLQYDPMERVLFGLGVGFVSPLWFFGLAIGGRRLAPFLARRRSLQMLDVTSGLVMLMLAGMIVTDELDWKSPPTISDGADRHATLSFGPTS